MLIQVSYAPTNLILANLAVLVVPKEPEVMVVNLRDWLLYHACLYIGFEQVVVDEPDLSYTFPLYLGEAT